MRKGWDDNGELNLYIGMDKQNFKDILLRKHLVRKNVIVEASAASENFSLLEPPLGEDWGLKS